MKASQSMGRAFMALTIASICLLFSTLVLAQTPEPTFFIVETMKTTPNKSADYEKTEREAWKKLHQERNR